MKSDGCGCVITAALACAVVITLAWFWVPQFVDAARFWRFPLW